MRKIIYLLPMMLMSIGLNAQNLNMGGVINTYTRVTDVISTCRIRVTDPQNYSAGQQVLIIQMKGAEVYKGNDANFGTLTTLHNAGLFEFNYIDSIFGDTVAMVYQLKSVDYDPASRMQMISVPTADVFNITGTLLSDPWNGNTGGVVVLEARDSIVFYADINVSGAGFRGGVRSNANYTCSVMDYSFGQFTNSYHGAYKGESFVVVDGNHITGRGPWGSGGGGGNNHNTGGAGGGNGGIGGLGGKQSYVNSGVQGCNDTTTHNGGIGGRAFNYNNYKDRVFLGSGGGGGHQNDLPSAGGGEGGSGGRGGGIVILIAPKIYSYSRTIYADGANQDTTAGRDGGGGGGAGGSVLLYTNTVNGTLNIQARGGKGADNNSHNNLSLNLAATHGTGGGGGGGYVGLSASIQPSSLNTSLSGGLNGKIVNSGSNNYNGAYGATAGTAGSLTTALVLPRGNTFCRLTIVDPFNDQSNVTKNDNVVVQVKKNDIYNRNVRVSICKPPVNGSASVVNFDSISYTPNLGYVGKDSLMYCLCTLLQPQYCDSAWVILTIEDVIVKAKNDQATSFRNQAVNIPVLSNDSINVPVSTQELVSPLFGSVTWNGSYFIYTPANGFIGKDSFSYQICSGTNPVVCDTAWVIVDIKVGVETFDDYVNLVMNQTGYIHPKANDVIDLPSVMTVLAPPSHGSVAVIGDSIRFVPQTNYYGYDTMSYRVCAYNPFTICDSSLIYIRIQPRLDAADDAYSLYMNRISREKVTRNDTFYGTATVSILSGPQHGVASISGDSVIYQPNLYYKGFDTLYYVVCTNLVGTYCDTARVVYEVKSSVFAQDDVNTTQEDVAVGTYVKSNDTEFEPTLIQVMVNPRHGVATVTIDDSLRYIPSPDYSGLDSIRYALCTVEKPSVCDTAWLRLTVFPVNDPPLAVFDTATTYRNRSRLITVLANDKDPDGDPITLQLLSGAANGTVTMEGTQFRYTPNKNFVGSDRFRYAVCDNAQPSLCDSTDVFVNVLDREDLDIPNGISPNGDGVNDTWVVDGIELINNNEVIILNRWGNVVWQMTNYDNSWGGVNRKGEALPTGTYYYVIKAPEEDVVYKGFIVIER